ncbi:sodium/glutamate symporter [Thalassotalea psychrophila]|uniref:Sodium/glutamate symporter n=1 Tax=Thalassotalea psychrophila TaxID=3065647 RepID=A0ABY9TZV1_9GAMM|nr:sodium/glutamate symporter [Colwelliaceae bacterium SQ149]
MVGIELIDGVLRLNGFHAISFGIIVLFFGRRLNQKIDFLKEYSIPEPVTGGICFSILFTLVYLLTNISIEFDLAGRDLLLVYFFTTIGINANLSDLLKGGLPLVILLVVTIGYMIIQNLTGIGVARLFDMDNAVGVLGGSVSLIGGHGTAIAWSPKIAQDYGITNAMEIGIACATFGLILASLMGGPIAKYLITKYDLKPEESTAANNVTAEDTDNIKINAYEFLDAVLAIHISVFLGVLINQALSQAGLELPIFVTCLFAGIILTNILPENFPRLSGTKWPSRTPAISLIADISLGTFLAMSLMSMQLWALVDLAGPIFTILAAQFVVAVVVNIFVVFRVMGKNYDAAVICSGFGGISLGSTPTAMANMSAVSQRYGMSNLAFIVVPLVCAFFIDLANALIIPYFLDLH